MRRVLLQLLVILPVASPALADKGPHKEGEYGGVVPGQKTDPTARPGRPKGPAARGTLMWIGFEAKNGGAQIFFQSVGPFQVVQHMEGTTLVAHLNLTRLGQNTWRQVDTRFFDNPLSGIVARGVGASRATKGRGAHGAGIDVRITFKNPKDAREGTLKVATEADGMHYAYLSFPEGADASAPAKPAAKPKTTDPEK